MGWLRGSEDSIGQEGPDVFDQRCIDAWKKKKFTFVRWWWWCAGAHSDGLFCWFCLLRCARLTVLLQNYTVIVHCRANLIAPVSDHKVGELD